MIKTLLQRIYNALQSWRQLIRTHPVILMRQLRKAMYIERLKKETTISNIRAILQDATLLKYKCICVSSKQVDHLFLSKTELEENLQEVSENVKQQIIADADKICEHKINLLSNKEYQLGDKINWLQDYKSGREWPLDFYSDIVISYPDNSDIKVPWELSRFYHIPILVGAFFLTKNKKYFNELITQISDWIDSNPPYFGPNWACPMEAAIRICNWSWFWVYFKDYVSDEFFKTKFLNTVWHHGDYIYHNLEYGYFTSNHYLSDVVGLIFLGIMFPEFKESKKWLYYGVKSLEKEMRSQVSSEGVDFEASTSYHRLVLELFLYTGLLCKSHQVKLSKKFWNRLEQMFEFVRIALKPNGEIPQFGDNDNGRVFILDNFYKWNVLDHRYLLAIGAVLFNKPGFKKVAQAQDKYLSWLFGAKELERYHLIRATDTDDLEVKIYKKSGYIFVKNHSFYFATSFAGNGGKHSRGGHGHNDFGSFELQISEKDVVVDPGTGNYTGDPKLRNYLRSQKQHNSLTISGEEGNNFKTGELFQFREHFKSQLLLVQKNGDKIIIVLYNVAYKQKLRIGYIRTFEIYPLQGKVFIYDHIKGVNMERVSLLWNYTLSPYINVTSISNTSAITTLGQWNFDGDGVISVENGMYSRAYGKVEEVKKILIKENIERLHKCIRITCIRV